MNPWENDLCGMLSEPLASQLGQELARLRDIPVGMSVTSNCAKKPS
jgi:hypothetical protein